MRRGREKKRGEREKGGDLRVGRHYSICRGKTLVSSFLLNSLLKVEDVKEMGEEKERSITFQTVQEKGQRRKEANFFANLLKEEG